ncbi:MAG: (Fe-S)-binding protein [Gammaproteobacteria bacterium]|nr:(Fe-S)-binding protein [Gammaproteobacteria bacterium]MDH3535916.1 (Fe-S)-binding protein [Gammaproteobacteria bacterium]
MEIPDTNSPSDQPHVGLFVTCLVDLFRPSVGFAAVELLQRAGCRVTVPRAQTCCGQPAFNSGDDWHAKQIAMQVLDAFEEFDYVVGPSGSCMGTIRCHYPEMFADDSRLLPRFEALCAKSHELVSFLVDVRGVEAVEASFDHCVTYHDSCSALRELGIKAQPRKLLATVAGLHISELQGTDICCGFGGTFCVKYPEISGSMVADKVAAVAASGADTLLSGDLGCLLNLSGKLRREGKSTRVYHVAEVLANMADGKSIGEGDD